MASGMFYGSIQNGQRQLRVYWSSVGNVDTNSSVVTVTVKLWNGPGMSLNVSDRSGNILEINGVRWTFNVGAIHASGNSEITLKTVTSGAIPHNADGTMSITIGARYYIKFTSTQTDTYYNNITAIGTVALDTIPRASSISESTATVSVDGTNTVQVTANVASETFYNRVTWALGDHTYSQVYDGTVSTFSHAIPESWLSAIPDGTSAQGTVTVGTFQDSACTIAVGEAATASFTALVPPSVVPVVASGWATLHADQTAGSVPSAWTEYVQGHSRVQATFDDTKVTFAYGATLDHYEYTIGGKKYRTPFTSDILQAAGSQTVRMTVVDSRGRTAGTEATITVYGYVQPSFGAVEVYRSTASHAQSETGGYVHVNATAQVSGVNGRNAPTITAAYRAAGSTGDWTAVTIPSGTDALLGGGTLLGTVTYDVRLTLTDRLGYSTQFLAVIPTADVAFNIKDGGKGAAFGKYAETDNLLDVDYNLRANGSLTLGGTTMSEAQLQTLLNDTPTDSEISALLAGNINQTNLATSMQALSSVTFGGDVQMNGDVAFGGSVTGLPATTIAYTTGEMATGDTWIDGKPVYRYVYNRMALFNRRIEYILCVIPNMDAILRIDGTYLATGSWKKALNYYRADANFATLEITDTGGLKHYSYNDDVYGITVIVEYTKTTDVATRYVVPCLTANSSQGCVASASSVINTNFPAWQAFNGRTDNHWASSASDTNRWIQIQMPHRLKDMVVMLTNNSYATDSVVSGKFLGSNDGSSWAEIGSFSGRPTTVFICTKHVLHNTTGYSYLRIAVTEQASATNASGIADIRIEGEIGT